MPAPMASAEEFRRIYRYNRAVMDAYARKLERLPWSVVSKDRGATWHSMAGVFHHIVGVYDGWLRYVAQGRGVDEKTASRRWDSFASMADIRAFHDAVWASVERLLDRLTDASLRHGVRAPWKPKACTLEDALLQVTLETAHHLGEIIAMLWQEDRRPPAMTWLDIQWGLEAAAKKRRRGNKRRSHHRNA